VFETVRLFGSDEAGIHLHTRRNRPILNSQAPATLDDRLRQKYARLLGQHQRWEPRKASCGVYNCSGHVWASRRTAIYDQPEIEKILDDDGYRALRDAEQFMLSDLVLYYVRGSFYHVGVVAELRPVIVSGAAAGQPTPWILSKWDDSSGEVLHHWLDTPWANDNPRTEFWTDRP
jgi:hypothetical protein